MTIKDKYRLLKDVKAGQFCDLLGEVIRFYEDVDRGTVYLSDYSPNSLFYNNEWRSATGTAFRGRDGDEYGYVKSRSKAAS